MLEVLIYICILDAILDRVISNSSAWYNVLGAQIKIIIEMIYLNNGNTNLYVHIR